MATARAAGLHLAKLLWNRCDISLERKLSIWL